ncbi:NAD(P)/FAD-dependent oxidoreductase [Roseobacter sp. S98]|uniref:NAD(P)/FAD-dependent oxidoreductase n=1 Tax=Roseobacter algicola (ex Choi et al. 2025) (nom. illeg.) TaxID=3092138 RepID=UPI0035C688A6
MVDITVRGAGILGLSIAWICTERGATVQVIDPNGPAAGSSGGVVGALAPHVPENWNPKKAFQLDSLLAAATFWQRARDAGGVDPGYLRSGRLQPIADEHARQIAENRRNTARALWKDHAVWAVEPVPDDPWGPASPSGYVIRDTLSALIHPRQACMALVAALETRGVGVMPTGADSGRIVWAAGVAGLEMLNERHHRAVGNGVKGQAAVLQHDAAGRPQLFADGVHIIPHLNGTVAIGSTSEREYEDPTSTDEQLDALVDKARRLVPALANAPVVERWAGVRPRARSRAPMLGSWPDRPGHFIANGGFKIGFGMAPGIAAVMADLVLEDRDTIPDGFGVSASL